MEGSSLRRITFCNTIMPDGTIRNN
ncbi:hypothetical protein [Nostoc sp. JL31]|nr:hypothetical protein [Nostoc sp. JL31]